MNSVLKFFVIALVLVGTAQAAFAGPAVTVVPVGNGVYAVQGAGFDGVAGAKITITYDKTTLANPQVSAGGLMPGALTAANGNVPGVVTIAILQPAAASGSGTLATIKFDLPGGSPGVITGVSTPELTSAKGTAIVGTSTFIPTYQESTATSSDASANAGAGSPTTGSTSGSTTSGSTTGGTTTAPAIGTGGWIGGVTMPQEGGAPKEKAEAPAPAPAPATEQTQAQSQERPAPAPVDKEEASAPPEPAQPAQASASAEKKVSQVTSVLEAFRAYQGEKSPKALVDVFVKAMEGRRQEPAVALSDGKTVVRVFVEATGKGAPNFALKGATLVSLKPAEDSTWIVEALPNPGVYDAAVTVMQGGAIRQIPVTVAPPLPAELKIGVGGKLTEADFDRYLKERGTEKAPRFDLNGDGKRDYIDDYIFTANYMVKRDSKVKGPAKEQK